MLEENEKQVRDVQALRSRVRHRLFQEKGLQAKFFSKSERELEFLMLSLIRIVGKENVTFLRPVYFRNTSSYLLEVDIRIPEILLNKMLSQRYQSSDSTEKHE